MKKIFFLALLVLSILYIPNHRIEASTINATKSSYWKDSYQLSNMTHVGHTYKTGTWMDGLVKNKTWTYVDVQMSNHYSVEYVNILTSPFVKTSYTGSMKLTYAFQQEFIQTTTSKLYIYLELPDGYQADVDLITTYNQNKSYYGYSITRDVNLDPSNGYHSYPSGFEYALALYKLYINVRYVETYRYEIGSIWSKSIKQNITYKDEIAVVAFVVIPVQVDANFRTHSYFFTHSEINYEVF